MSHKPYWPFFFTTHSLTCISPSSVEQSDRITGISTPGSQLSDVPCQRIQVLTDTSTPTYQQKNLLLNVPSPIDFPPNLGSFICAPHKLYAACPQTRAQPSPTIYYTDVRNSRLRNLKQKEIIKYNVSPSYCSFRRICCFIYYIQTYFGGPLLLPAF